MKQDDWSLYSAVGTVRNGELVVSRALHQSHDDVIIIMRSRLSAQSRESGHCYVPHNGVNDVKSGQITQKVGQCSQRMFCFLAHTQEYEGDNTQI